MTYSTAVIFLLDNSSNSINGDFYPSRLGSQARVVEKIVQFQKENAVIEVAAGALAGQTPGIFCSLSPDGNGIVESLSKMKSGGEIKLFNSIRCSFLAFRSTEQKEKAIVAFVGSHNDLNHSNYLKIADEANRNDVSLNIVALGNDVNNTDLLMDLVRKIKRKSVFVEVDPCYQQDELINKLNLFRPKINIGASLGLKILDDEGYENVFEDIINNDNINKQIDRLNDPDLDSILFDFQPDNRDNKNQS